MTDQAVSAPPPVQTRCPLWVRLLLAVSLALNLAIVGAVVGFVWRGGPLPGGPGGLSYAAPYIIALDRQDRRAVFRNLRRDPALPDRGARRAQYQDMLTVLRADPWDRDAVAAVLARQDASTRAFQTVAQAAWLDQVARMSPDDRRAYADAIARVLERGPRRDKPRR